MEQQLAVTPAEAALLQAIRADLKGDEIGALENTTLRTFAVSALIQSVRAFLEFSRTGQPVHLKGDGKNDQQLFEPKAVTWEDVTRYGDWEEIYPGVELLTSYEAAELLGKSQPTILSWIKSNRLLALQRKGKRGLRLPAEQFENGRPVDGLAEIIDAVGHAELAWRFLTTPLDMGDDKLRPIEQLKTGKEKDMQLVIQSARSFASDFA